MGDGRSGEYIFEQRDLACHRKWLDTPEGTAAVLKYPDLAEFSLDFDPNEKYLDPNSDYARQRSYWESLTPAARNAAQLKNLLDKLKAKNDSI
jgi:hypothetical protein